MIAASELILGRPAGMRQKKSSSKHQTPQIGIARTIGALLAAGVAMCLLVWIGGGFTPGSQRSGGSPHFATNKDEKQAKSYTDSPGFNTSLAEQRKRMRVGDVVTTETGQKIGFDLPDGSRLYLNENTQVTLKCFGFVAATSGADKGRALPGSGSSTR